MENLGAAWRCWHCGELIYNRKYVGDWAYPAPGAPPAHYISTAFPRVCSICFFLWQVIGENPYWLRIQDAHKDKQTKYRRLLPGGDYLG